MPHALLRSTSLFAALLAISLVGCGAPSPVATASAVHWGYEGNEGPDHWGDLDPKFSSCKTGHAQTPIDLPSKAPAAAHPEGASHPKYAYEPFPLRLLNNGHTIQVHDTAASSIVFEGTTYKLDQFHFHAPSEHTLDGKSFDAEMHMVHKSDSGKVLVVGFLFSKGKENATLKPVWDALPMDVMAEDKVVPGVTVNLAPLFPASPTFDHYTGSLTVPPCTEGLTWLVVMPDPSAPLEMSEDQIARFRAATHGATNRPIQPLNGRTVESVTGDGRLGAGALPPQKIPRRQHANTLQSRKMPHIPCQQHLRIP